MHFHRRHFAGMPAILAVCLGSVVLPVETFAQDVADDTTPIAVDFAVDLVTDYRFRGISLSDRDPAVQPSMEISHPSGLHAGVWGSNIADNGGDAVEIDLAAGYIFDAGSFAIDLGGVYYVYPGAGSTSYVELLGSISHPVGAGELTLLSGFVPGQAATGHSDNFYASLAGRVPLAGPLTAKASLGWEDGAFAGGKVDWSLGLDYELGHGFDAGLSYIDTARSFAGEDGEPTIVARLGFGF